MAALCVVILKNWICDQEYAFSSNSRVRKKEETSHTWSARIQNISTWKKTVSLSQMAPKKFFFFAPFWHLQEIYIKEEEGMHHKEVPSLAHVPGRRE